MKKKIYLLVLLFLGIVSHTFAQKGRYHVRFTVKTIDCSTGIAVIALQVKASTADSTFLMGDANYRFDYDPRIINNPTIVSQENYSSQAPANDVRYGVQNLNGSTFGPTKGTVSLNTTYGSSGTGAALVTTNWTTVSCLQFDIVNTQLIQNNCFSLVWHTNTDFPITGMNEYIANPQANNGYELKNVTAGGVFGNLQVCIPEYCSINAVDDVATTPVNTPVNGNVRSNDLNTPSALVVTTTPVVQPKHGSITLNPDGSYLYTPSNGYSGKDSVQYQVCLQNNPTVCDVAWLRLDVQPPIQLIDLSLVKTVSKAQPALQEVISYTLALTNNGTANATGVEVKDLLPAGLTFQSSNGNYNANTGIWTVGTVNVGATVQLVITAQVTAAGTWFNKAEVSKADLPDIDSTPNNDNLSEDDISVACIAIPVNICDGDVYQIGLPSGYSGIQWYKDGQAIQGATGSTLQVTTAGSYSFTATNAQCPIQGCCPAIFVNGDCCKPTVCIPITITQTKKGRL
ncbi:Ig-like domain-containing protein [Larkinella sp. VNQ87]|uniref:Ig-like domain-containing protein n=1 Tax=Larkinella sp. VNQ87 TaxID=3400921 RepID=UPI003BFB405A